MSSKIVGNSKIIKNTIDEALQIAKTHFSVFLSGESGVGKGVFARFIQENSPRCNEPFIIISCADISQNMLEDVLFGHEKGAFTGATTKQIGKFELADKGTLFLDEVGDLSRTAQSKLLRVLQDKELERLGGNQTIKVDVRVITATNKDVREMMAKEEFRKDLFYRINSVQLNIPPLRNRLEDVQALAENILKQKIAGQQKYFHTGTLKKLERHPYLENNIRELEGIIETAIVRSRIYPCIRPKHIEFPPGPSMDRFEQVINKSDLNLDWHIAPIMKRVILEAMVKNKWVKAYAAKELGIKNLLLDNLLINLEISSQASSQYLFNFIKANKKNDATNLFQDIYQEQLSLDKLDNKLKVVVKTAEKNGCVTNNMIQKELKISSATAKRLLSSLVKLGLLHKEGNGRGAHYSLS